MIELRAATVWTPSGQPILSPTSERFVPKEKIGILAAPGSGKTTLARIFAGLQPPQQGRVIRSTIRDTILGQENLLHPHMALHAALTDAATLLGLPHQCAIERALRFAGKGLNPTQNVSSLSPVQKSALSFALSLQRPGQWLIADDRLVPSDPGLAASAEAAVRLRLKTAGLIYISKNATQLQRYCDRFFVLAATNLIPVPDLKLGPALFRTEAEGATHDTA